MRKPANSGPWPPEEEKLKHKQVQMSSGVQTGVSVDLNAQTGATVNAPVLTGNTITSVTFNYSTADTSHKNSQRQQRNTPKNKI
ncbi:hypothetical protein G5714_004297 [Onychostoma macrolepis]|uniref:Uncharacterized protein n=1 Tax=Onychostoma macrolepis TaxID=369639 RepID=A0A7J6D4U6_9TELE|nr:hypothetical protein G5714_004297 [Onychostoma macrolepis]